MRAREGGPGGAPRLAQAVCRGGRGLSGGPRGRAGAFHPGQDMRILLGVHQFFPRYYAGTERYVLNLARQLSLMGHEVQVLTYDLDRQGQSPGPGGKLFVHEYTYQGIPVTAFSHPFFPDFNLDLADADLTEEVQGFMEREGFDVYHCAHPLRIAGSLEAARRCGLPTVLMLTDYWLLCPRGILRDSEGDLCGGPEGGRRCLKVCFRHIHEERLQKRQEQVMHLADQADVILAPSCFLISVFHGNDCLKGRISLSRHGFDYALLEGLSPREAGGTLTLGYIGTLEHHKGVHVLLEAFLRVDAPNLRLEIWGGSLHETAYEARLKRMAIGDGRIRFRGAYAYEDLKKVLHNIDVVVVPSLWYENAPLTILSSHAAGIPVIASSLGGMAESVQDGVNGMTFPVGDVKALAERLERLARKPELVEAFQRALSPPPRLEEEAFRMERLYRSLRRGC
ncbi:MAG: glycosyltransferase [Gammaproteobacteria bacterium]|nr:MAG: glycosyltransferase [Gammaproteobacteria bacterium]